MHTIHKLILGGLALYCLAACAVTAEEKAFGKSVVGIGEKVALDAFNTWLSEQ